MTHEQLVAEVVELMKFKSKAELELETFGSMLKTLRDNVAAFTKIAEDVHIMANNMGNLQKAQEETNKKVDMIVSQEFLEYKENKKIVKQNIINKVSSGIIGAVMTGIIFLVSMYFKG